MTLRSEERLSLSLSLSVLCSVSVSCALLLLLGRYARLPLSLPPASSLSLSLPLAQLLRRHARLPLPPSSLPLSPRTRASLPTAFLGEGEAPALLALLTLLRALLA